MLIFVSDRKPLFKRGENPSSQRNLNRQGGKIRYEQKKKQRIVYATDEAWEPFKAIASEFGLSASEFVEQIGRKKIKPVPDESWRALEAIAVEQELSLLELLEQINEGRFTVTRKPTAE